MTTTILFDLDGTLLPMDQERFTRAYFGGLAAAAAPHGYEAKTLTDTIWAGTAAMVRNTGAHTNEQVFWQTFLAAYGEASRADMTMFDDFYATAFQDVRHSCGFDPRAADLIHALQATGVRLVLATNPIFPKVATDSRIRWAGLEPADFAFCTTFENSRRCKPNPEYYRDILAHLHLSAEECIMVGNDVDEDMVAETLGMKVFLLTDCLINRRGVDIDRYPHGDMAALAEFLRVELAL